MTKPIEILQRLAVISSANLPVPPDLAKACAHWLAGAAGQILNGQDVADALGLKSERGAWQNAPVHRARRTARDNALRGLWEQTTGRDMDRARQMLDWIDSWQALNNDRLTGDQARCLLDDVPDEVKPHLDELSDIRLRVPEVRQLLRVIRGVSHGAPDAAGCGPIDSKAAQGGHE